MDDGVTWTCAKIQRFVPGTAAGKHWAWIHWSLEVPVGEPPAPVHTSTVGTMLMPFTVCSEHSDVVAVVHRFSDCTRCAVEMR